MMRLSFNIHSHHTTTIIVFKKIQLIYLTTFSFLLPPSPSRPPNNQVQANVDPAFTCLVWQKLLDQNPNFFYGYALRLRLKDQIIAFNYLIDQHSKMLQQQQPGNSSSSSSSSSGPSAADASQMMGGLQQQQLNDLKQM